MQEGRSLTDREINRGLLHTLFENPLWFWGVIALLAIFVIGAMGAAGYMVQQRVGGYGAQPAGDVGILHHQFRVLDRDQPRRGDAVGDPEAFQGRVGGDPLRGLPRSSRCSR